MLWVLIWYNYIWLYLKNTHFLSPECGDLNSNSHKMIENGKKYVGIKIAKLIILR